MKLVKIIIASIAFTSMVSCEKLVNIQETDLIAGDIALKTVSNVEAAVLGGYNVVSTDMSILLNSTFADEVARSEFYNATTTHEWQYGSVDIGIRDNFVALSPNFRIIDRVNRVLRVVATADSTRVGDNVKRARLRGEALFLRAYAHFELFQFYCNNYDPAGLGMPYLETPSIIGAPRINMGVYFQKLLADIAEAKTLVPNNLTDINRASFASVSALHARVALYMRDWANEERFSTDAIAATPLSTRANFTGIWTDANAGEVLFRIVRTNTIGARIGSLFRGTSASATQIGTVTWQPSEKLWSSYDQVNDIRFSAYLRSEPLLASRNATRLINKYAGTAYGTANENVANGKAFRTSEMFLIRAEARAEQNNFAGATSDLNTLRAARISNYVNVADFTAKPAAIDAILLERFKELPFEGHRFFDIKRRSLAVTRLAVDAPSPTGTSLSANNFRFVLPIPLTEIQANPAMVQNPNY